MCEKEFNHNENYRKVKDHFTGKYRDAVPYICNLRYAAPKENPIIWNNGFNYD